MKCSGHTSLLKGIIFSDEAAPAVFKGKHDLILGFFFFSFFSEAERYLLMGKKIRPFQLFLLDSNEMKRKSMK